MRTRIVAIGNSQGVRIPKPLLQQAGLEGEVELHAEDGRIIIASPRRARAGWAEAARRVHESGQDEIEASGDSRFDREEWEWR
jgi:antitoxin MazE